jgi:hypothetical protein
MSRTRQVAIAVIVCLCAARNAGAQAPQEGWVVLPVDEYRALRARANLERPAPTPFPVDATLTRLDYELRADPSTAIGAGGDTISGRALLTVDVLREGWVIVPIPSGLRVREALIDGQPLPLVEGPASYVVLSRAGRSLLSLEIALPITSSAGAESITLPSSHAPVSRATLSLPRGGIDLTIAGGFISERSESTTESRWTALGRAGHPLTISWKRKADDRRAELPLRYRAQVASSFGLGEEVSTMTAAVRIEVLQGQARSMSVAIPAGLVVNQVNGATIADWNLTGGLLNVRLLDPVATEVSFVVQGESRLPAEGEIAIPLLRVPAAERETGGVAISVLGAGEIEKHHLRGLETGDVSDLAGLGGGLESPSTVAFRLRPVSGADLRSLNVSVKRYTPQAVLVANVEEARYRALAAEDGRFLVEARYAVRNNQRSFLKLTLPRNATIWSAAVGQKLVRPGVAEGQAVLLPLEKSRAGEDAPTFVVRITYLQTLDPWINNATARLDLPALDLPISRTGIALYHSPRFRIDPQAGAFRIESDPGVFAEALRASLGLGAAVGGASGGVSSPLPPAAPLPPPAAPPGIALRMAGSPDDAVSKQAQFQMLIDRYRNEGGGRTVSGALPIDVTFPEMGPSLFMASELTAESGTPSIDFQIRRIK